MESGIIPIEKSHVLEPLTESNMKINIVFCFLAIYVLGRFYLSLSLSIARLAPYSEHISARCLMDNGVLSYIRHSIKRNSDAYIITALRGHTRENQINEKANKK